MKQTRKGTIYETVAAGIRESIDKGVLEDGAPLPSCRDFALRLGINPNTVQRAYSLLEAEGYITVIPKKGVYARGGRGKDALCLDLTAAAEREIRSLRDAGLTKEELLSAADRVYGEMEEKKGEQAYD